MPVLNKKKSIKKKKRKLDKYLDVAGEEAISSENINKGRLQCRW